MHEMSEEFSMREPNRQVASLRNRKTNVKQRSRNLCHPELPQIMDRFYVASADFL
jgi:hypothetical protein